MNNNNSINYHSIHNFAMSLTKYINAFLGARLPEELIRLIYEFIYFDIHKIDFTWPQHVELYQNNYRFRYQMACYETKYLRRLVSESSNNLLPHVAKEYIYQSLSCIKKKNGKTRYYLTTETVSKMKYCDDDYSYDDCDLRFHSTYVGRDVGEACIVWMNKN